MRDITAVNKTQTTREYSRQRRGHSYPSFTGQHLSLPFPTSKSKHLTHSDSFHEKTCVHYGFCIWQLHSKLVPNKGIGVSLRELLARHCKYTVYSENSLVHRQKLL